MFKLVVCNAPNNKTTVERLRNSTKYGYKNKWELDLPGTTVFSEKSKVSPISMFTWRGPDVVFMLFKLTENTNLLLGHVDIDEDNGYWFNIPILFRFSEIGRYSSCSYRDRTYDSLIYENYLRLLAPIKDKFI